MRKSVDMYFALESRDLVHIKFLKNSKLGVACNDPLYFVKLLACSHLWAEIRKSGGCTIEVQAN